MTTACDAYQKGTETENSVVALGGKSTETDEELTEFEEMTSSSDARYTTANDMNEYNSAVRYLLYVLYFELMSARDVAFK
jgi:hypothetical protein